MSADREYAEQHGITLREFQRILLRAQGKRGRKEPLTQQEQEIWDLAMAAPKGSQVIKFP